MADAIQQLIAQNNQLWAAMRGLQAKVNEQAEGAVKPRFVEDIPGKRIPYTYIAQGSYSTTTRTPISFQVSQDGPFVATAITAHWRPTAGANAGLWLPISQLGQSHQGTTITELVNFEYEISQGGSDRLWQNLPRSSKDLFSDGDRPHYLSIGAFVERNETITVNVTMLVTPTNAGLLKFEFWGYKILAPIAFSG